MIGRNPIAGVRRPRAEGQAMRVWSADEARAFLHATGGDRLAFAWALLLTRGFLRLRALRTQVVGRRSRRRDATDRVDADNSRGPAGRIAAKDSGGPPFDLARRRSSSRCSGRTASANGPNRSRPGPRTSTAATCSPTSWGARTTPTRSPGGSRRGSRRRASRASACTTVATRPCRSCSPAGVPVKVVSEIAGHASPTITLSVYAHVMPGMAEEAGAALSASLLG